MSRERRSVSRGCCLTLDAMVRYLEAVVSWAMMPKSKLTREVVLEPYNQCHPSLLVVTRGQTPSDGGRSTECESEPPFLSPPWHPWHSRLSGNIRLGDPPMARLSSLVASRAVPTSFHLCKVQLKSCFFLRVFCIVSTHAEQYSAAVCNVALDKWSSVQDTFQMHSLGSRCLALRTR